MVRAEQGVEAPTLLSFADPIPASAATPTLARLYLAQGHPLAALKIVEALRSRGESTEALEQALESEGDRRRQVLETLLGRVRVNRRPAGARRNGNGQGR